MIPVDVDRDEAREAARRELADPLYQAAEPSLVERTARWLGAVLTELFTGIGAAVPGGVAGLIVLALLAVLVVVIVRLRAGPVARGARRRPALFDGSARSADEH
ncbi:MAG TPA: hypothetical protein VGX25_11605, partial [Actinophytocola sp.]|nr:hypothetical protein [Actinophytocola sp.]